MFNLWTRSAENHFSFAFKYCYQKVAIYKFTVKKDFRQEDKDLHQMHESFKK